MTTSQLTEVAVTLPVATPKEARRELGRVLRPDWRAASLAVIVLGIVGLNVATGGH